MILTMTFGSQAQQCPQPNSLSWPLPSATRFLVCCISRTRPVLALFPTTVFTPTIGSFPTPLPLWTCPRQSFLPSPASSLSVSRIHTWWNTSCIPDTLWGTGDIERSVSHGAYLRERGGSPRKTDSKQAKNRTSQFQIVVPALKKTKYYRFFVLKNP